jgi:hypothetical protein
VTGLSTSVGRRTFRSIVCTLHDESELYLCIVAIRLQPRISTVQQARGAYSAAPGAAAFTAVTHRETDMFGRSYSRMVHTDSAVRAHIESWTIHGAGQPGLAAMPEARTRTAQ